MKSYFILKKFENLFYFKNSNDNIKISIKIIMQMSEK